MSVKTGAGASQLTSRLEPTLLEAWVLVEEAAAKSGFVPGASVPRANPSLFLDELVCLGKLARGSAALIEQLSNLRNQATHLLDFSITEEEADI